MSKTATDLDYTDSLEKENRGLLKQVAALQTDNAGLRRKLGELAFHTPILDKLDAISQVLTAISCNTEFLVQVSGASAGEPRSDPPPQHTCGPQGFQPLRDNPCPACEVVAARRKLADILNNLSPEDAERLGVRSERP